MKGFRQQAETSRKERLRSMEAELKNSQMSQRISQMLLKQLMDNQQNMQQDLGRALGLINEMQYKLLAYQQVANLDVAKLNDVANGLRLKDFNDASNREDQEGGFTEGDVVTEDSTVVITSTTENVDKGIFRSRIKLSECGVKDLIDGFMGRPVGAKIITKLNGEEHTVELLAIRNPPPAETVPQATDAAPVENTAAPSAVQ
jgi:hypothetical protein